MEKSDSFAIIDINISDKERMDSGKDKPEDGSNNQKSPFSTVIKFRKFFT